MESMSSVYCHQNAIVGEYLIKPSIQISIHTKFYPFFFSSASASPLLHTTPGFVTSFHLVVRVAGPNLVLITVHWPMVTRSPALAQVVAGSFAASANWRATAERAVYCDGESECKIIDYGFGWKSLWYDVYNYFQKRTNKAASFLGYSLRAEGWGMVLSSSTRAQERPQPWLHTCRVQRGQLREAVSQTRHHQGRASFHVDIWLLHIVRTIIYSKQEQI